MDSPEHIFREFLRQRKLKYTTERMAILRAVEKFQRPFEAEELLLTLREAEYRISKATIYRTLKHLLEAALVQQIYFGPSKQCHYDFVSGEGGLTAHDHLLDLDTGKIVPFSNEMVIRLREQVARSMGLEAVGHRFQITARHPKNAQ